MSKISCKDILVTIITVCFNSESSISDTIESVLSQTYKNIEYIIVDGKSTDRTLEIIKRYEPKFEGRMRIISEPDSGIYDAMNKGIRKASGTLIGILNSDDYYETNAVEHMVHKYQAKMVDEMGGNSRIPQLILYGFQRNLLDNKEMSVVLYHHENLKNQMITHPTCFVTRTVYEKQGVFDLQYQSSADYEYMLRVQETGEVIFQPVYHIITNFRMGGMSSGERGYRETARIQYRYGGISKWKMYKILIKSVLFEMVHR